MEIKKYNFKIALIGDGGVGKTSIRRKYMGAKFPTSYIETIGADFAQKLISTDEGYDINYQIWDMAGQARYNRIRESYYIGVSALLIVYSVTRPDSLDSIETNWLTELKKCDIRSIPIVLIGNKIDLVSEIDKDIVDGSERLMKIIQKELDIPDQKVQKINTSAKTGENIEEAFNLLTEIIVEGLKETERKI
jgi:small GTP-binding protein